ncbi:putative Permease [Azospirillaceae bacterium]
MNFVLSYVDDPTFWLILSVVLGIIEALVVTSFLLPFAASAIVVFVLVFFDLAHPAPEWLLCLFAGLGVVLVMPLRVLVARGAPQQKDINDY